MTLFEAFIIVTKTVWPSKQRTFKMKDGRVQPKTAIFREKTLIVEYPFVCFYSQEKLFHLGEWIMFKMIHKNI